jgi:hypothetical protein
MQRSRSTPLMVALDFAFIVRGRLGQHAQFGILCSFEAAAPRHILIDSPERVPVEQNALRG